MNKKSIIILIIICTLFIAGYNYAAVNTDDMYQVSLLQSFMHGEYDGVVSVDDLKSHGDTGLGTFNGIDGEMIMLDGVVYKARADGSIQAITSAESIPFATVTFFNVDNEVKNIHADNFDDLTGQLSNQVNKYGKNEIYVAKLQGKFDKINVRSVEKQSKPYKEFTEVASTDQRFFNYTNQSGTIVAVYFPDYMSNLNMAGWHLHFLSDDKTKGGHVLDVKVSNANVGFDKMSGFEMILPDSDTFNNINLTENMTSKIHSVE